MAKLVTDKIAESQSKLLNISGFVDTKKYTTFSESFQSRADLLEAMITVNQQVSLLITTVKGNVEALKTLFDPVKIQDVLQEFWPTVFTELKQTQYEDLEPKNTKKMYFNYLSISFCLG